LNGLLFNLPTLALNPNDPTHTGIQSKPAITLLSPTYKAPQAKQASVGYTMKVGASRLFFDSEAIYVKGENEITIHDVNWSGNATHVRPNTKYDQINMYTNDGESEYKALVFSLNGTLRQSDLRGAMAGKLFDVGDENHPVFQQHGDSSRLAPHD